MRLTTALAALTLLCTVFLVQAAPLTPGSRHDATACARLTDCDSCVRASHCGFSLDTQSCAAKEGHPGSLATSAIQCKKASAVNPCYKKCCGKKAEAKWKGMKNHVLNGRPDKANSGRHLTSTWFAHNANKGTAGHMTVDPATALAHVQAGKGPKTLWVNKGTTGMTTNVAHKYTRRQVAGICKAALRAALKAGNSRTTVTSGSYSVRTPTGTNICVAVSNAQCYPANIHATTVAAGGKC
ncbi:uncharacterized protein B0H18DRAFT_960122 [Fomitopsis serialis]|uniref:uncharacterized protein n=1 Tax=Fomitopsis serialis TaxID=139415 RepID=UPI00200812E5|nr:uncharacterized protein B0H18DRAFT_960122 [Neoantrodia serialis]KAH9913864.1 hypothetical protein B0H18DRAFT_960122 [Neoantrodia serialis]